MCVNSGRARAQLESDLVMLDVMNRPLIIHNLRQRFLNNEIYVRVLRFCWPSARSLRSVASCVCTQTNVGTILVSVNPYKLLPLYTPQLVRVRCACVALDAHRSLVQIDKYRRRGTRRLAPHVFEIADNAYNHLMERRAGQARAMRPCVRMRALKPPLACARRPSSSLVKAVRARRKQRSNVCSIWLRWISCSLLFFARTLSRPH